MATKINPDFNSGRQNVRELKEAAKAFAEQIEWHCPSSPQKERALMDLQSAQMFAVSSMFGDS